MFRKSYLFFLFFVFAKAVAFAQTPLPGYSDPLINIDFDSGAGTFGPPYQPGYTNFIYTSGVPDFGFYTRLNNTNVNPNWWLATDHTANDGNNGYMFVAKPRNGVADQVLFYADINSVCSGTQYQVSTFFLNLTRTPGGVQPSIVLMVVDAATGNPIAQSSPEVVPQLNSNPTEADWKPQALPFTVPSGVSNLRLLIICQTTGGASLNDFAVDDIAVNAMGQKIDVAFTDGPGDKTACAASPESFNVSATPPQAGNVIRWQAKLDNGSWTEIAGATSENYTIISSQTPGRWSYRAASGTMATVNSNRCNVVSNEIYITVNPGVQASAGPDKFYLIGNPPVMLQGSSNTTDLTWEVVSGDMVTPLGNANTATPLASPTEKTTYRLTARAAGTICGPDVTDEVTVTVAVKPDLPTAFSPNGDGINDKWIIGGIDSYPNPSVQIYNRNGQLVYRNAGIVSPWDGTYKGKAVPAGNYYYIIDLGINGAKLSGSVTVLR